MGRVRRHKVVCAICGRKGIVEIDEAGNILTPNWRYYGRINLNALATSKYLYRLEDGKWKREANPHYDPRAKRRYVEYWEEAKCGATRG